MSQFSVGFLIDPIESLNVKKDSTIAMMRAAQARGWQVHQFQQSDLFWRDGAAQVLACETRLVDSFADSLDGTGVLDSWYVEKAPELKSLSEFDVLFMRKDPPFDMDYIYSTYFLDHARGAGVMVVNRPDSLRDCNEKFFATDFAEFLPPTIVSQRQDLLIDFYEEQGDVIYKQIDGMGGTGIFRVRKQDPNLRAVIEMLTHNGSRQIMAQRFVPEIANGDKRILLVDGEPVPYGLARIPMLGDNRGNLAVGGVGVGIELSSRDLEIAKALGPDMRDRGLRFVGIDVIGDYLTEINVTCPTCIREIDREFGTDIAALLMDKIEASYSR